MTQRVWCVCVGLLTMVMETLYAGEVPDITIVPVNISYDRTIEEVLFAYEMLGVAKPKESTSVSLSFDLVVFLECSFYLVLIIQSVLLTFQQALLTLIILRTQWNGCRVGHWQPYPSFCEANA